MFPKQFLKSSKKASFSVVAMENNALSLKFQMTDDDDFRRRNQIFVNISLLRKGGPSCFLLFYRVSKSKLDCLTKSVSWNKYLTNSESQKIPTGSKELSVKVKHFTYSKLSWDTLYYPPPPLIVILDFHHGFLSSSKVQLQSWESHL